MSPVPVAVGFGVSRPAHVRALVGAGRRRGHRRLGAGRRARPGRARRRGPRPARGRSPRGHRATDSGDASDRLEIGEEIGVKRTLRWAIDWPGLGSCREDPRRSPLEALVAYAPRYAIVVAALRRLDFAGAPGSASAPTTSPSSIAPRRRAGTDFGVPSAVTSADRRPTDAGDAAGHEPAGRGRLDRPSTGSSRPLRRSCARDPAAAAATARLVDHVVGCRPRLCPRDRHPAGSRGSSTPAAVVSSAGDARAAPDGPILRARAASDLAGRAADQLAALAWHALDQPGRSSRTEPRRAESRDRQIR